MKFEYRPDISLSPDTGEPTLIVRPVILVRIFGPRRTARYRGLVDTGADNTIFPTSVADELGVPLKQGRGPELVAFGGQKLSMQFGDVEIEVAQGGERFRWTARVQFFEFSSPGDESLVLGHAGFLDYFTATFDGARSELILVPNEDLPTASTEDRDVGR